MSRKNQFIYGTLAAFLVCLLAGTPHSYAEMPGATAAGPDQMPAPGAVPGNQGPGMPTEMPQPSAVPPQTAPPAAAMPGAGLQSPAAPPSPLPYTGQPIPGEAVHPSAQAPAAPQPARPAGQARVAPAAGGSSFFFDDADVFEVIQTVFGEVLRVNYIIDPAVKGRVNFRTTTPIPRDKILPIMEIILRLNGIAVIEESGLYRIIPMGNISKEPAPIRFGKDPDAIELKGTAIMQLVPLTYINSSEMASILTPLITQGGAIYDITKRNILIIADTDANVRRLLQVIAMFDVDTYKDATQPKVYVYPLQNSKAEHVAKILQQVILGTAPSSSATSTGGVKTITGGTPPGAMGAVTPKAGPTASTQPAHIGPSASEPLVAPTTKIIADEVANTLVIFASPADYSVVLGAIKQIDTTPRQVMIEAVVASVTMTDNLTLGMRWNLNVGASKLNLSPFSHPITVGGPLGFQGLGAVPSGSFGYTALDPHGNVRIAIEADAAASKAKILSAPNILVADNREARIQVGSQIPIATSTTSTPLSATTTVDTTAITNTTTSTIQYKDVGTILKVKPQVNDSGLISLEISQEVSSADTQKVLGTDQFVITKNEVSTNLVAQDGETIVIGGLVNETDSTSRDGIPGLSKIPLLGFLFGTDSDKKQRQELVILLTPRVVRNQDEAKKMTSDYYELFKNVGKELDIEKHKKTVPVKQQNGNTPSSRIQSNGISGAQKPAGKPDTKSGAKPVEKP